MPNHGRAGARAWGICASHLGGACVSAGRLGGSEGPIAARGQGSRFTLGRLPSEWVNDNAIMRAWPGRGPGPIQP